MEVPGVPQVLGSRCCVSQALCPALSSRLVVCFFRGTAELQLLDQEAGWKAIGAGICSCSLGGREGTCPCVEQTWREWRRHCEVGHTGVCLCFSTDREACLLEPLPLLELLTSAGVGLLEVLDASLGRALIVQHPVGRLLVRTGFVCTCHCHYCFLSSQRHRLDWSSFLPLPMCATSAGADSLKASQRSKRRGRKQDSLAKHPLYPTW